MLNDKIDRSVCPILTIRTQQKEEDTEREQVFKRWFDKKR